MQRARNNFLSGSFCDKTMTALELQTVQDKFIKFHTSIKHHKTMCRATTIRHEYVLFYLLSFELGKKQFCDKIVSVLDMKTVKDIFLKLHTNIKYH